MGPRGEGGGVHEVRELRGLVLPASWMSSKAGLKRMRQRETIITSDNGSYRPQRCRLILQNFSGVNSGRAFRDGWKRRSTSE